ncbi:MAG: hypothetical protein NXI12_11075 [Alphaproteobacteria bacterium]|nr:hypothetical protein [Alphaproteobacteria bacterium]
MARHHVALSPCGRLIIVAVSGVRDDAAARASTAEALALRTESGVDRILFDTRFSVMPVQPQALMSRAMECGRRLERSRVALLCEALDDTFSRVWRKGLVETGHEAIVFTDAAAAEAWLMTEADAPMVYVP